MLFSATVTDVICPLPSWTENYSQLFPKRAGKGKSLAGFRCLCCDGGGAGPPQLLGEVLPLLDHVDSHLQGRLLLLAEALDEVLHGLHGLGIHVIQQLLLQLLQPRPQLGKETHTVRPEPLRCLWGEGAWCGDGEWQGGSLPPGRQAGGSSHPNSLRTSGKHAQNTP